MPEHKNNAIEIDLETMASNGVHLGALKSRSNPKMKPYVWSNKNTFQIIDLEKSKENLKAAISFLAEIRKKGGLILFVGTGVAAKDVTKKMAESLNMPYVSERWLGGTLTNFQTISKRVNYLKELENQEKSGGFEKYTKYETLKLREKMRKLSKEVGGLRDLNRLPDAVWVSSANYDKIAVAEAVKKEVPVIGIINTNADPTDFNYPIPGNDTSLNAVNFIVNLVKDALLKVKVTAEAAASPENGSHQDKSKQKAPKNNGKN